MSGLSTPEQIRALALQAAVDNCLPDESSEVVLATAKEYEKFITTGYVPTDDEA